MDMGAKIAASLASRILAATLNIVLTPVYVGMLGIEAYGIIGFYVTLLSVLQIFDFGITPTVTREAAHLSARREMVPLGALLRTFEGLSWAIGAALGGMLFVAAPVLANHWFQPQAIDRETIRHALAVMAVVLAVQWPIGFYTAAMVGLQNQGTVALAYLFGAMLRGGGAVLVLWLVDASLEAFFVWQAVGVSIHVLTVRLLLWLSARRLGCPPRFSVSAFTSRLGFLAGAAGVGVVARLTDQMDKVVLCQRFSLELFGYYALAATVANGLLMIVYTIHCVLFPPLCHAVSGKGRAEAAETYHTGTQVLGVGLLPAAVVIAVFAPEVLKLWTGDPAVTAATEALVRFLVLAVACEGLAFLPDGLQMAFGWTRFMLLSKSVSATLRLTLVLLLASRTDLVGVAVGIAVLNALIFLATVPYVHRRLLQPWLGSWFARDLLPALAASLLTAVCWRTAIQPPAERVLLLPYIVTVSALSLAGAGLATPTTRRWLLGALRRRGLGRRVQTILGR